MNERIQSLPPVAVPDTPRGPSRAGYTGDEAAACDWFGEDDTGTRLPIGLGAGGERFTAGDIDRLAERILGPIGA